MPPHCCRSPELYSLGTSPFPGTPAGCVRGGWGGQAASYAASYAGSRRQGFQYDAAGNVTSDVWQGYDLRA